MRLSFFGSLGSQEFVQPCSLGIPYSVMTEEQRRRNKLCMRTPARRSPLFPLGVSLVPSHTRPKTLCPVPPYPLELVERTQKKAKLGGGESLDYWEGAVVAHQMSDVRLKIHSAAARKPSNELITDIASSHLIYWFLFVFRFFQLSSPNSYSLYPLLSF